MCVWDGGELRGGGGGIRRVTILLSSVTEPCLEGISIFKLSQSLSYQTLFHAWILFCLYKFDSLVYWNHIFRSQNLANYFHIILQFMLGFCTVCIYTVGRHNMSCIRTVVYWKNMTCSQIPAHWVNKSRSRSLVYCFYIILYSLLGVYIRLVAFRMGLHAPASSWCIEISLFHGELYCWHPNFSINLWIWMYLLISYIWSTPLPLRWS